MKHYHKSTLQKILPVCLLVFGFLSHTNAQEAYGVLVRAIDSNNRTLAAYQKSGEAQKMLNQTGLTPADPEIGVNYLRMNPRIRNQRLDYSVSQNFGFPTVYRHKKNVSAMQNELVDTDFRIFRADLINNAINTYLEWIYYTQLGTILKQQKEYAASIATSYQKAFESGGVNALDRNKAQINAINAQKEYELNVIEANTAYQELLRYNLGQPFDNLSTNFPDESQQAALLSLEENRLISTNAALQSLSQSVVLSQAQEKLAAAQALPEFSIGFMREQDIEVDFKGVTFGMTIPLWQQKNTRKYARLNTLALRETQEDSEKQFTLQISLLQNRAAQLYRVMNELESTISQTRGMELLKKALELREITILEYLVEQSMYFELTQKHLQTQLNLHSTLADLNRWMY